MQSGTYVFTRRLTWLIIIVGGGAVLISIVYLLARPDTEIVLPITRTALDAGWFLVAGLIWLGIGVVIRWWLPADSDNSANVQPINQAAIDNRLNELANRVASLDTRQDDLAITVQNLNAQLSSTTNRSKPQVIDDSALSRADLDHELGTLTTLAQDAHGRIDKLDGVDSRLHDLESQLDALYVTLQDIHQRIDGIELTKAQRHKR